MDCVIPVTLESNVVTLHQFLYGEDALYSPSSTVKKISDHIAEESGFMKVVRRLRLLPVPENQTARASHPEQVKIMLRPRLLHKQQLKKVLKQKKQQRRPAIQRIKQQQKRVQQLLLKTGRLQNRERNYQRIGRRPRYCKAKRNRKAETAADESSKGPGVQKTTENSENDNVSGENTGNTDPIGPGV